MPDPLTAISTRAPPQDRPARGPEGRRQTPNAAGGFAFQVSDETLVHRFLTLGTAGGTYYASGKDLTEEAAEVVLRAARDRGAWLVELATAISVAGRAPRQQSAIFALAAVAGLGDDDARRAALEALPRVCRTGTHLFLFAGYVEQFRGWGPALRRAVGRWYLDRPVEDVAHQAVKYRQRGGWTHRDLLRLAHPVTREEARRGLFGWITTGEPGDLPIVRAFAAAQAAADAGAWVRLIDDAPLSWEMLPDAALGEPAVWEALIAKGLPQTALLRQLPRLTRLGVLTPGSAALRTVVSQLGDGERLRRGRVHPVAVLLAQRTYASGQSARGTSEWQPVRDVVDALDAAFYTAFGAIEPAGRRTLLALDVSGSMGWHASGLPISCREVSAALALVTTATEPETTCVAFTSQSGWGRGATELTELSISPRQRLDDAVRTVSDLPFGGTDCALPMLWAARERRAFDTFVVYTDNETWAGRVHPHEALRVYRERMGIDARLVVVGLTATKVSIADPLDPSMLDVAGFDAAVPQLIADFSRGDL